MKLKNLHGVVGGSTVVVFLGTGLFMRIQFPDIYEENEVIRFLFRANHVYLLFSGLLNVMAGLEFSSPRIAWKKALYVTGSWLLILSSPLFLGAFIIEPLQANPMRPLTITSVFLSFVGVAFHAIATWRPEIPTLRRTSDPPTSEL